LSYPGAKEKARIAPSNRHVYGFLSEEGVKCKVEITSDDEMSVMSKNSSDDLPNQEKNL